jgi:hypothetical protein
MTPSMHGTIIHDSHFEWVCATLNKKISAAGHYKTMWNAEIAVNQVLVSDHVECSDR